jgi:agarase
LGCALNLLSGEIINGSSEYVDVHTFNYYRPVIDPNYFAFLTTVDKPAIISEFHFGAFDRGGIHPGISPSANQAARAQSLINYMRSAIEHPNFVGAWWYQYVDCPITGWEGSGINYAAGFVDITDTPYPELIAAARSVNAEVYVRR